MRTSVPKRIAWNTLAEALLERGLSVDATAHDRHMVTHLTQDSRQVRPGSVFVAIKGLTHDGHNYVGSALRSGAAAVVCQVMDKQLQSAGAVVAHVTDSRKALAVLASTMSGDAHHHLHLYGITGTNGKTTTCYLLHHVLSKLIGTTGLLGTVAYKWGNTRLPSSLTTPGPVDLHTMMRQMVNAGCRNCVMEVSSHSLKQDRPYGLSYQGAVFTNLSQDHLDYHTTWSDYRETKRKLFTDLPATSTAIYNADDPAGQWMVSRTAAHRLSYGTSSEADIRFRVVDDSPTGLRLLLDGRECYSAIAGRFNAYNVAAAYAAAQSAGLAQSGIVGALSSCPQVPGRLEWLRCPDSTTVVVDYAHTPDALEKALQALKTLKPTGAALWCVFGCGGERDKTKRPVMGRVAETEADNVIVTSDNPRSEPQARIFGDIAAGMDYPEAAEWQRDRRLAIHTAILTAAPGDLILVAGRGHETMQIQQGSAHVLSDRFEVQHALFERESICSTT